MQFKKRALMTAFALLGSFGTAQAVTSIQLWHSMTAVNNEWVNDLARQFNESQTEYRVEPRYKGSYDESMTAAIAAFRSGGAPHILQVFEVGTATMMASRGATVPVGKVMADAGVAFTPANYIPAVVGYYTAPDGQMLSFPFNSSTTVFFYNKDAFRQAGLDPEQPPRTWKEVFAATAKLKARGHSCPLTISWQGWTQLESFSAWHNVEFATHENGLGTYGHHARMKINSPLHVRHIENLARAASTGEFVYKGRGRVPDASFAAGECAMITGSSSAYGHYRRDAKFKWGISTLPYYDDVPGAPQNTVIGGASLWVMGGKSAQEYTGVAKFFEFLSREDVQATSHQRTGYLPVTMAAFHLTEKSGFYQQNPGAEVAVNQMVHKVTNRSRGIRLGNYVQIRTIEDEELELVWAGKKSAQEALDAIVKRSDKLLARFERAHRK